MESVSFAQKSVIEVVSLSMVLKQLHSNHSTFHEFTEKYLHILYILETNLYSLGSYEYLYFDLIQKNIQIVKLLSCQWWPLMTEYISDAGAWGTTICAEHLSLDPPSPLGCP